MEVMTFTEEQLAALVASVFWPFIRITAMFAAVPLFSNKQLQTKVKVLLALLIALLHELLERLVVAIILPVPSTSFTSKINPP